MRTTPKKPTRGRSYEPPEDFDQHAQDMQSTVWYRGSVAGSHVEGPDGAYDISRRVAYLINPIRGSWLIGIDSVLLGRGGSHYCAFQVAPAPVGHVMKYETRKDEVERRIVSAQILTPAQQTRRRVREVRAAPVRTSPRLALGAIASATV